MQNNSDTPMVSEFLAKLKTDLLCGQMKASDAALAASRLGRLFFTESHLAALTRELLGYSEEQSGAEIQVIKLIEECTETHTQLRSLARHRVLRGYRMPLFAALRQQRDQVRPRVKREDHFCSLSACEIEELVQQAESASAPYIVLDWSDTEEGVFICSTSGLRAMQDGMKELIVWCIDLLIKQLQLTAQVEVADDSDCLKIEGVAGEAERAI